MDLNKELKLMIYESSLDESDKEDLLDIVESTNEEEILSDVVDVLTESKHGSAQNRYLDLLENKMKELNKSIKNKKNLYNKTTNTKLKNKLKSQIDSDYDKLEELYEKFTYYTSNGRNRYGKKELMDGAPKTFKLKPEYTLRNTDNNLRKNLKQGKDNFKNDFGGPKPDTRKYVYTSDNEW